MKKVYSVREGGLLEENKISNFNKFPQKYKNIKKKAFSIAEAFITLAIVGIAIGSAAPLISKQLTAQNLNDAQFKLLQQKIVPSGAIMFFKGKCPDKWTDIGASYGGRYIRIAGDNAICDKSGEAADGKCVNTDSQIVEKLTPSTLQGETSRRVWGTFPGNDSDVIHTNLAQIDSEWYGRYPSSYDEAYEFYVNLLTEHGALGGAVKYLTQADVAAGDRYALPDNWEQKGWRRWAAATSPMYNYSYFLNSKTNNYFTYVDPAGLTVQGVAYNVGQFFISVFDNKIQIPVGNENRPKTLVLRACEAP